MRSMRPSIDGVSTNDSGFVQPIRSSTVEPCERTTSTERTNPAAPASSGCGSDEPWRPQSGPVSSRTCTTLPSVAGVCEAYRSEQLNSRLTDT